jgi:hypothetical protein
MTTLLMAIGIFLAYRVACDAGGVELVAMASVGAILVALAVVVGSAVATAALLGALSLWIACRPRGRRTQVT